MRKAFTLIELLVIIAIISLLSSIALRSLQEARLKAHNVAINNYVLEYAKIFELYRTTYGAFPGYDAVNATGTCLDSTPNEFCLRADANPTPTNPDYLKNTLLEGIEPNLPVYNWPIIAMTFTNGDQDEFGRGITYSYGDPINDNKTFYWYLNGANQACARPANTVNLLARNYGDKKIATQCMAILK